MGTKEVKIAEIMISDEVIDITGKVREEALVFEKHYNVDETERIISMLREHEWSIGRKLQMQGYFFNDTIGNVSVEPEIIVYLLKRLFGKNLGHGGELGQLGKAIYFDKDYVRRDGRVLSRMVEELYNRHYYNGAKREI